MTTKRFNKTTIMTNAWELFRANMGTFAECLKMAWNNAKAVIKALADTTEECHTWYGWKMLGFEVIHESVAVAKAIVTKAKAKKDGSHEWINSYFTKSQVAPIEG